MKQVARLFAAVVLGSVFGATVVMATALAVIGSRRPGSVDFDDPLG